MPTQRIIISVVICVITLFSCDQKKNRNIVLNETSQLKANDTIFAQPGEALDVKAYSTAFTESITQTFTVAQRKVSIIKTKKGLKVTVNPSVLEKEDGTGVDGAINVSIIELTTSEELFKSNAATVSNERLLASGGSYYIGMDCNGQKLRIKEGQHLQMQFPRIKKEAMQLFYGEQDTDGDMNWLPTNTVLTNEIADDIAFTDTSYFNDVRQPRYIMPAFLSLKPYYSLNEKAYFYDRKMPIKDIIDTINKHTKKVFIDTIYPWPKVAGVAPVGARRDTNYMVQIYGPYRQYLVKSYRSVEEKNKLVEENEMGKNEEEDQQPKRLADQLLKYYESSSITSLGWINCDRYYEQNNPVNVPLELPITFNKGNVHYFIIFRSFNGLISGKLAYDDQHKVTLNKLPAGQAITLVAFTKTNGEIFHCKKDIIVQKDKSVQLDLKAISAEQIKKIFGKNIHI